MSVETLFALCACALVGIGLYGLIVQPHPLRKLVAFNIMGTGVFVLFGALAKRGAAAGIAADPVPQALVLLQQLRCWTDGWMVKVFHTKIGQKQQEEM